MKNMSKMIKIKKIIKKCPLAKKIYTHLLLLKNKRNIKKQQRVFEKFSLEVLESIQNRLSNCKDVSCFFFMFGTLLGIYRDNKLLKRDMDIDVGVYLTSVESIYMFRDYMKRYGYNLLHFYSIESLGIIQDSFEKDGVKIDIAYLEENDSYDCCYLVYGEENKSNVLRYKFHKILETIKYSFSGLMISIPNNSEQYLEDTYGKDWRIPNPQYKYWKNPNAEKTEYTAFITICHEDKK